MRRVIAVLAALAAALVSVMIVGSTSAQAASLTCTGINFNQHFSSVIVPPGSECLLAGSTVSGGVTVSTNAALIMCDTAVGGSLSATQAYLNVDPLSSIGGSVSINKPGATQLVGTVNQFCEETPELQPNFVVYNTLLCPWYIGGSVNLSNAQSSSNENTIGCGPWMQIGGPVMIVNNYQPVEIGDAVINGTLTCVNNHPQAEEFNVSAKSITGCLGP